MIKAVRGTRDLLPPETALWNFVEAAVRDVFRAYNFHEIRTPIFEETQLFARAVGEETDVVSKEMYTWYNGRDPLLLIYRLWREQYGGLYAGLEPLEPEISDFGYTGYENGIRSFIRIAYQPSGAELSYIRRHRDGWLRDNPGEAEPKLVLAYPAFEEGRVKALSLGDIEPMQISMPAWFRRPESLTLRPENTAGVVRAYIEHNLESHGLNKLYYIGPQFRRERPQKGRYRQFYQIGAEVIGPPSSGSERPLRDAELIEMLDSLLKRLGINDCQVQLNSVGSLKDRAIFSRALREALEPIAGQMCDDCQRRAVTNPLRVFDCKVPGDQLLIGALPRISQYLDHESKEHFQNVQALLKKVGVSFSVNDRLVRGLDYYTRTAFEFTHGALGAQNSIVGGGRYDGLSEALGGPPAPGIGFAMGEDRLILALQELMPTVLKRPDVYIAPVGEFMNREAIKLASELRRHDLVVELGDRSFKLKKLFEIASKLGARFILIVGENEVKAGAFALKNLESGEQVSVPRGELAQKIQAGR